LRNTRKKLRHERIEKWSEKISRLVIWNWENPGKLQESWEGPYIAKETSVPGAFQLLDQNGEELPHSWNANNLKRYYP
jgi:hypothetical protein